MDNNSFDSELHRKIYEESFRNKTFRLDLDGFKTLFPAAPKIGQDLKISDRYFKFIGQWNFKEFYVIVSDAKVSNYKVEDRNIFIGDELSEPLDLRGFTKTSEDSIPGIEKLLEAPMESSCVVCSNERQLFDLLVKKVQHILAKKIFSFNKFQEVEIVCCDLYKPYIDHKFYDLDLINTEQHQNKLSIKDLDDFFDLLIQKSSKELKQFLKTKKFICFVAAANFIRYKRTWQDLIDELINDSKSLVFFWELESDQESFIALEEKWNCSFISLDSFPYSKTNLDEQEDDLSIGSYIEGEDETLEYPDEFSDILSSNFEHSLVSISNKNKLIDALCYKFTTLLIKKNHLDSEKECMIVGRDQKDLDLIKERLEKIYSPNGNHEAVELCSIDTFLNSFTETKNLEIVAVPSKLSSTKKVIFFFDCLDLFVSKHYIVGWLKDLFRETKTVAFLWEFKPFKKNLKIIQASGFMNLVILLLKKQQTKEEPEVVIKKSFVDIDEEKISKPELSVENKEPEYAIPDLYSPPAYINNHAFLLQLNKDFTQLEFKSHVRSKRFKWFYGPIFIGLLLMVVWIIIIYCV